MTIYTTTDGTRVRRTIGEWTFNQENHEFDAETGIDRYEYHTTETRPLTLYVLRVQELPTGGWEIAIITDSRYGETHNVLELAPTKGSALGIAYAYMEEKRESPILRP